METLLSPQAVGFRDYGLKWLYQVFDYLTWLHDVIGVQAEYKELIVSFLSATAFYIEGCLAL